MPLLFLLLLGGVVSGARGQGGGCAYTQFIRPGQTFTIQSPSYPGGYRPGTYCTWSASTSSNGRLVLTCDDVQIPQSRDGCVDHLITSPTYDPNDGRFYCGSVKFVYVSPGQQLTLALLSDSRKSWGGRFSCSITSQPRDVQPTVPPVSNNCDCGYSYKWRIVGGVETGINEFPLMAGLISTAERGLICGATIVSKDYVLTAAHCVVGRPASTLGVLVGEHNIRMGNESPDTKLLKVSSVVINDGYNTSTQANDIALVRTADPIQFTMRVGPACLPWRLMDDFDGMKLTALGWGTKEFGGETSDSLQKVNLDRVDVRKCVASYGPKVQVGRQICTLTEGKDACQFDSGGPLVYFDPSRSRYFLVGIISYGNGCALDRPSVNTKVASYMEWIRDNTPDQTYCVK